jgi:vacuolar protein sorting-associated protein 72
VDSDFDQDENDFDDEDNNNNQNDDDEKRGRIAGQRGVVTKAYKEPKVSDLNKDDSSILSSLKSKNEKKRIKKSPKIFDPSETNNNVKTFRSSTSQKRQEAAQQRQQKEKKKQNPINEDKSKDKSPKNNTESRRLTQEELLEEAKKTEIINLASLDAYLKMEHDKKKQKTIKTTVKGPSIRYKSVTMPLLDDNDDIENESRKQSRTFITFSDDQILKQAFPNEKPKIPIKSVCSVTGLPAKYFDPLTKQPYANITAFKVLRDKYSEESKN